MGCCTSTSATRVAEPEKVAAQAGGNVAPTPPTLLARGSRRELKAADLAAVGPLEQTIAANPAAVAEFVELKGGLKVLGRYRLRGKKPLGEGGWCEVWAADCLVDGAAATGTKVAVKTFHRSAIRGTEASVLEARFVNEISIFRRLGISEQPSDGDAEKTIDPRQFFVNLLDFTQLPSESMRMSGVTSEGGRFFSMLEYGDCTLDSWLETCLEKREFVEFMDVQMIARVLAEGLAWMRHKGLCHLDVKPANIMRFGNIWKIIDLEGCLSLHAAMDLDTNNFTPLYTAPEVAKAVLSDQAVIDGSTTVLVGCAPATAMDLWAAGVALMDVLAHAAVFQEIWSGFQMQQIMQSHTVGEDVGIGFKKDWYEWLSSPEVIVPANYVESPASSVALLKGLPELQDLLSRLLEKDPAKRLSVQEFQKHAFLKLEAGSLSLIQDSGKEPCVQCGKTSAMLLDVTMGATHEGWGFRSTTCKYDCARCKKSIAPGLYVNACRACRCMWHKGGSFGCFQFLQEDQDAAMAKDLCPCPRVYG